MEKQRMPDSIIEASAYALFAGEINQDSVQRIFGAIGTASRTGITSIHLLFQSAGGFVGDSVCLYNFFKTANIDLTLYNVGSIQSGAVIAYLGAKKRKTSARATFMLHRAYISPQMAGAGRLKSIAEGIVLDDQRTDSILREHLTLTDAQWSELNHHEMYFSGEDTVKIGLANEIADFAPPPGQLHNL
jgi:ATP-dependent Clp protease protease subunit